jgi:hypothetical protein
MGAPKEPWTHDGGVTFPESAAVPVVLQLRSNWRCGTPRRVSDSVGDVLGVRREEPTVSKELERVPLRQQGIAR